MRTDLSKYNQERYNPGNKLFCVLWYFVSIIFFQKQITAFLFY